MSLSPLRPAQWVVIGSWLTFVAVWMVSAMFARRNKQVVPAARRARETMLYLLGVALIFARRLPLGPLDARFLPPGADVAAMVLTPLGVAFAVWSRFALGRNWSGRVTLKEGHELIQTGPYALARNPIYTGMLTAMAGGACLVGNARAFLGVLCFGLAFALKIRDEERLLSQEFGPAYAAYRARVKSLIPFIW